MAGGRPKAKYSQAHRILRIVEMLQHRQQLTIQDIMTEFDIDRRTVQRDMAELGENYAIEEGERTAGNCKTFQLRPGSRTETLKLTISEMIALYMGRNMFAFAKGTDLKDAWDSLYEKLQTRLCARNVTVRETLPKKLFNTSGFPKYYGPSDDVLNDVLTALIDEKKLAITYQIPNRKPYSDVIHPYTLALHNNALYVIAYSEHSKGRRNFAIERIKKSKWRGQGTFNYPKDYDPAEELSSAFGITTGPSATPIRLWFAREAAPYIAARQWHRSMKTKSRKDGSLEVSMQVNIGEELLQWITGYGGNVRVMSPKSLRDSVLDRHKKALARKTSRDL